MKNYNIGTTNLDINPIINPINSYHFKDKRKIYSEYFKNFGNILVNN